MKQDIRIAWVDGTAGLSRYRITFTYPDRFYAQRTVAALATKFIDEDFKRQGKAYGAARLRLDEATRLELLDTASLPENPGAARRNIVFGGLVGGTLIGGLAAWWRKRNPASTVTPAPPPAMSGI
ncbi:MAG: hypothetical protein ABI811_20830 [Acidobacteriota bacterium]